MDVLIVGGNGEFGQFLQRDILPQICVKTVSINSSFTDILRAFRAADDALNRGADSPISTKWYERLRTASLQT
jgi:hypothetical protein